MRIQELGSEEGCYGAEKWYRNASLGVAESTIEKYPRSFIITIPRHSTWEVPSFVASIPRPPSSLTASHAHLITCSSYNSGLRGARRLPFWVILISKSAFQKKLRLARGRRRGGCPLPAAAHGAAGCEASWLTKSNPSHTVRQLSLHRDASQTAL